MLTAAAACALPLGPTLLIAPAAAEPAAPVVDRHAVVLVDFRDRALADPEKTRAAAVSNFFGTGTSLTSYYDRVSGGDLDIVPVEGDGVFGPVTIDMDDSASCDVAKMMDLARKAVPETAAAERVSLVVNTQYCKNWWGLGSVPGPHTWFHEGAVLDKDAIVHEVGHNLGFTHQRRELCPVGGFTGCTADGYSNRSPMGAGGSGMGLSGPEMIARQWVAGPQIARPTSSGRVRLTPLHAAGTAGTRLVDLPLGSGGDRIVVEYRTPDADTADRTVRQGVVVYRVPGGDHKRAVMISNLKSSDTSSAGSFGSDAPLTDEAAGLSITVTATGTSGADISVRLGDAPAAATQAAPVTETPHSPTATAQDTARRPASPTGEASTAAAGHGRHDDPAAIGTHVPADPGTDAPAGTPDSAAPGSPSPGHRHADTALAATGASDAGTAAAVGGALIAAGGVAVLLLRRRTRHGH
ncbi:LPXTG cell wall anchor domain-containing protein [Streptomyces sp. NPDC007818]|uniref:LPXTG cell wall anchor domain-containing protein n=1 Tax=Streptomyces sp. NPDC007818 TaxID=3364780 RepID=UPI0036A96423